MVTPLVLLPGVLGSRLHFPNVDKFWDPDHTLRMVEWLAPSEFTFASFRERLAEDLDHSQPAHVPMDQPPDQWDGLSTRWSDGARSGWDGVPQAYYEPLLVRLRNQFPNTPVYAIGYDWRQDIAESAVYVRDVLNRIPATQATPPLLITHSMGGLVARSAIQQGLQAAGAVHVCQPVCGAVVLYRRFFTGDTLGLDGDLPLSWILGNTAADFANRVGGMPGVMQLMPTNSYTFGNPYWISPAPTPSPPATSLMAFALYAAANSPPGLSQTAFTDRIRLLMPARIRDMNNLQAQINGFKHNRTWCLVGGGRPTECEIRFDGEQFARQPFGPLDEGDETVPFASGSALFPQAQPLQNGGFNNPGQWRVDGVSHATAMTDEQVMNAVIQIIQAGGF